MPDANSVPTWEQFLRSEAGETVQEMVTRLGEVLGDKNHDYGYAVFLKPMLAEDTSIDQAIRVRMGDKIQRLTNLQSKDTKVTDESINDTLRDLSGYATLLLALRAMQSKYDELCASDNNVPANKFQVDGSWYQLADESYSGKKVWVSNNSPEDAVANKCVRELYGVLNKDSVSHPYVALYRGRTVMPWTAWKYAVVVPE